MASQRNDLPWVFVVLLGLIVFVLAPAHLRAQPAPGESGPPVVQTALDYAAVDSALVTNGLKLVLSNTDFTGNETSLAFELNFANLWSADTVPELVNLYERDWFNLRNFAIVGSASQLVDAGDRTGEIDEWSLGFKWAIYDTTNLFRPATAAALIRSAADSVRAKDAFYRQWAPDTRIAFFDGNRDALRRDLKRAFNDRCTLTPPANSDGDVWKNWKDDKDEALSVALQRAEEVCSRKDVSPDPTKMASARAAFVDAVMARVADVVKHIDCSGEAPPFDGQHVPQLGSAAQKYNKRWATLCKKIGQAPDTIKKRAKDGWSVSLKARWMGDTEVLADGGGGADAVMLTREHARFFGFDVSRRWRKWDKYFLLATLSGEATLRDNPWQEDFVQSKSIVLAASVSSSPVGWAGDKGLVATLAGNWRRERDENDQLETAWGMEQQVALPLDEKVFLQFNVREAWTEGEGEGWDIRPTMTLAWTYENDDTGKSGTSMIQH